jgi:hypothetical protein
MALTPATVRIDACWKGYVQVGMKRKGKREVPNCVPASSGAAKPRAQKDTEDDKKYTKVVTNPETGRKNRIRYGAKGYRIAPGTDKGDRYCARSFGDMKSEGYDCSGAEKNTPLCLSRAKWKCSGKTSRRDADGMACGQGHIARGKTCHKRGAFPTGKAIAAGLTAGAVTALTLKGSRQAILASPAALRRTTQRAVTAAVHRATAPEPSMRLTPKAFNEAKRALKRSGVQGGLRRHNLTLEALRRRTEPGYRKPRFPERKDGATPQFIPSAHIDPARLRRDAALPPGKPAA